MPVRQRTNTSNTLYTFNMYVGSVANLAGGTIKVHPYACETACQYLKYIVHVQYRCGKQSEVDVSLNHHAMASFPFHKWTRIPKIWVQLGQWNELRVHPYAWETSYQYLKDSLYVYYGYGKQSEVDVSLNHDEIASFQLHK